MNDQAMIAFLPTDTSWCKQEFPHMTLVYAGRITDRAASDFNTMAKDAITCARIMGSFSLEVSGLEVFGPKGSTDPSEQVDVLTFLPTSKLLAARQIVDYWNASEFKEFRPHVTIGPTGSAANNPMTDPYGKSMEISGNPAYPTSLYFHQIAACWGDEKLIFNLRSEY
jgi:2'-5' RNA ligase